MPAQSANVLLAKDGELCAVGITAVDNLLTAGGDCF